MNENIRKKINTYRRGLENTKLRNSTYLLILFVAVFFYGFFGLWKLVKVISEKRIVIEDLTQLNSDLESKMNSLDGMKSKFIEIRPYVKQLEAAIPASPDANDYLLMLVNAASTAGFKQKNLTVEGENADLGSVFLNVSFQGPHSQLGALVTNLERLPRLTVIKSLSYSRKEKTVNVNMALEIFYLPSSILNK